MKRKSGGKRKAEWDKLNRLQTAYPHQKFFGFAPFLPAPAARAAHVGAIHESPAKNPCKIKNCWYNRHKAVKERVGSDPLTRERPGGGRATATLHEVHSGAAALNPVQNTHVGDGLARPVQNTNVGDGLARPVRNTNVGADGCARYSVQGEGSACGASLELRWYHGYCRPLVPKGMGGRFLWTTGTGKPVPYRGRTAFTVGEGLAPPVKRQETLSTYTKGNEQWESRRN